MNTHLRSPSIRPQLAALARKYSRPGPRYTSYPPANHFSNDIHNLRPFSSNTKPTAPLSLYFHIPFCKSLCWYCGCHTFITQNSTIADKYLDDVHKEIALHTQDSALKTRPVIQIHLGGGTPNFLTPAQIHRLNDRVRTAFTIATDAEISVELDPRTLDVDKVSAFKACGFNRASFGIQDCNPDVQKAIHRIQPHAQNIAAIEMLRTAGMSSLNVDLIYGLPLQTPESFAETIASAIALQPDRLTLFSYAHVPWMKPSQKQLEKSALPDAEAKLDLFTQAVAQIESAGYCYIGMDHFARVDDELVKARTSGTLQRNFQGYSTRAGSDILGLGVSSISQDQDSYRQNVKDLKCYTTQLDAGTLPVERGYALSDEDKRRRTLIMELMCNLHLDFRIHSNRLGVNIPEYYAAEIAQLKSFVEDGLLTQNDHCIQITDTGRFFIRNIAMAFDSHLRTNEQAHSKTV